MKHSKELEAALAKTIDRYYKKNDDLRVAQIRAALKGIDKLLLTMLSKSNPKKWRTAK